MADAPVIIFFEDESRTALLPFTYTRPTALIRTGIMTIAEKWQFYMGQNRVGYVTEDYLNEKYPDIEGSNRLLINGNVLPTPELAEQILQLKDGHSLITEDEDLIAVRNPEKEVHRPEFANVQRINNIWDIFAGNHREIKSDFKALTNGRESAPLNASNFVRGKHAVFLEAGARVNNSMFNTEEGPVYIGKDAEVMEGCMIKGPFALCNNAVLKMGTRIYGGTTIGPWSKVGGELNNSVIFGYSNKAHDGFLGNSVIGEWCNLGADTNNSNLKNNYAEVKLWNYASQDYQATGLQFCGLFMADHSKAGINTMFNTGTVVGVSSNVFGSGFPRKFIPSFAWGGADGLQPYYIQKALEVADAVMKRRGLKLDQSAKKILQEVQKHDANYFNRI